jgi:hypothetical protein
MSSPTFLPLYPNDTPEAQAREQRAMDIFTVITGMFVLPGVAGGAYLWFKLIEPIITGNTNVLFEPSNLNRCGEIINIVCQNLSR